MAQDMEQGWATPAGSTVERHEVGTPGEFDRAAASLFTNFGMAWPETDEQRSAAETLMTGFQRGTRVFTHEYIAHSVGESHFVDFGMFPTARVVGGQREMVRLTDQVGGWSIRVAVPVASQAKYVWVVMGLHDESVVPMEQARDAYGRARTTLVTSTDPATGDIRTFEVPVERPRLSKRSGRPYTIRQFTPVLWKRFDCSGVEDLQAVVDLATELAQQLIDLWESYSVAERGEDERVAAAADRALSEIEPADGPADIFETLS